MCKRKIIHRDNEWTVHMPLTNCDCPMIREFRHVPNDQEYVDLSLPALSAPKKTYSMPMGCYDIQTQVPADADHTQFLTFRHCMCFHPSGICLRLPPMFYEEDEAEIDDDTEGFDGSIGIRPTL